MKVHPVPRQGRGTPLRGEPSRRIGVLGGTFDPIHLGHLILAESARGELDLEYIIFVPAGDPWRKAGQDLAAAHHRLAMVRLATADNPHFLISTVEIDRSGPSYTADTLAFLKNEHGIEAELFVIMGQDALADLPYWMYPERIIAQAMLAVAQRTDAPPLSAQELEHAVPGITFRLVPFAMPTVEVSATTIRQRCGKGRSIRYLVPATVEEYIRQHNLYTPD